MMAEVVPFDPSENMDGETISEDWVARQFANLYRHDLKYDHTRGGWYEFDGFLWKFQETPKAFHYTRELALRMSLKAKNRQSLQKFNFCKSVEGFARADPAFAVTADHWDKNIFLLGTPAGTVDLKTGILSPGDRRSYITKSTAVGPEDFEDCSTWLNFLMQATNGDKTLIRYLQQICGYALTGDISEQALFFIFGKGGNGKGVFLSTIQRILGDYSVVATMEALEQQKNPAHTTDLAMMQGARLVSASETDEGAAWNEKRIKALTGGDQITARFLNRNNTTFLPQFTLLVIGNHKPTIRSVDDAMRRRFNMIPFTVTPQSEDKRLPDKFQLEWPAILRWMINGCLDWQANGFVKPDVVVRATAKYFEDQDLFSDWLRTYCETDPKNDYLFERSSSLFASWASFAKKNGVEPGNAKTFKPTMEKLGFEADRSVLGSIFKRIRLKSASPDDDGDPFSAR